jgi:cytochrome bd-type quinol oxidase subunit 2
MMTPRLKAWLLSLETLLVPVLLIFPVMAFSGFGPCGPSNLWGIVLWGVSAGVSGAAAIYLLHKSHQSGQRDWMSIVRFPLWVAGALFLAISGVILFFTVRGMLYDVATHLWWFFLFLVITLGVGLMWIYLRKTPRREVTSLK